MTDEKDMALTLRASGFVRGEWTEEDIAAVLAPERDALIAQQAAELERQAGVIAGLRDQVQAVREVCERYDRVVSGAVSAGNLIPEVRDDLRSALTAALDGGDDE